MDTEKSSSLWKSMPKANIMAIPNSEEKSDPVTIISPIKKIMEKRYPEKKIRFPKITPIERNINTLIQLDFKLKVLMSGKLKDFILFFDKTC